VGVASVMAGLGPAIHALENLRMPGGWVYILTNKRNGHGRDPRSRPSGSIEKI